MLIAWVVINFKNYFPKLILIIITLTQLYEWIIKLSYIQESKCGKLYGILSILYESLEKAFMI